MNPIRRALRLAAVAVALGAVFPALAADVHAAGKGATRAGRQALAAERSESAAMSAAPVPDEVAPGQVVYQVLLAEIGLQRGDIALAVQAYVDLVQRTRDPRVIERAVEVAALARRFDLATELARLWLEVEPGSLKAQKVLVSVLIMSNQLDELPPHLIALLKADTSSLPENLVGLTRMLAGVGDRQAVLRVVEQTCQPFFGIAEAHYALAVAAGSAGQTERANAELDKAIELRPDWEPAVFLRGQIMLRESRGKAIVFLEDFLKRQPEAREVRLLLARALIGEQRYADARRHFDQLLQAYPDNPEVVFAVALLALQFNDRALAETQLKRFVTFQGPDHSTANFYLGQIAEEDARRDEAIARYAQVQSGEQYLPAKLRQARLLSELGRLEEARALLASIKTKTPEERIQLIIGEAALLREAGKVQEALDFLERQLAENSTQPDLMYETALLAERLGRVDVMESRLRHLIEQQPDNPQAYNALGYALADRNQRLPEARQLVEKALSLAPDDGAILDSMGWVLFRQGDLPGALGYLQRSYDQREDPEIAAHLGEVLWTLGRKDEAKQFLLDAQKKFPVNDTLNGTIRRLAL